MQNIHTHAWDQNLHMSAETVKETDLSRGYSLDLTVTYEKFAADMAGFDKIAVFGLKARLCGYWVPDNYIADFVKQDPDRLVGFASCDPTQEGYLDELKYAIETLGLKGVKMGPVYAGFHPQDKRCDPVYSFCQERGIPMICHTGTTFNQKARLEFTYPVLFDEVAIKYPGLKLVLAHLGHPFYEECIAVIRKHPNLYADIAALYYRPWQFYNMLITAQEYKVTGKLLFGTDYPFATAAESVEGLRNVNQVIGTSGLPKVSETVIKEILERDTFSLLGVDT